MEYELEPDTGVLQAVSVKYWQPSILWHPSHLHQWQRCCSDAEFYTTLLLIDITPT